MRAYSFGIQRPAHAASCHCHGRAISAVLAQFREVPWCERAASAVSGTNPPMIALELCIYPALTVLHGYSSDEFVPPAKAPVGDAALRHFAAPKNYSMSNELQVTISLRVNYDFIVEESI